ncbi:MAG: lipoprotein-releasing system ATP-binding protein LolD, partial [Comamonas sp.]|nr:lipoprotein-releasing system ATP-binding protein LolD [Comamonas sp.]
MNDVVMGQSVLEARGLTKRFAEGKLDVTVLQGV